MVKITDNKKNKIKKEYICCAAIYFNDGKKYPHQPKNISAGIVVCGLRHCNCFVILFNLFPDKSYKNHIVQGFLTSHNNFVDRKDAGAIAFKEKQIIKETDCLFSEELY